jgi:hypothetical protein
MAGSTTTGSTGAAGGGIDAADGAGAEADASGAVCLALLDSVSSTAFALRALLPAADERVICVG